ncbi:polysaccharide deacetylase family protein [Halalkalibacterium halodurans]|uniref:Chitooligosaccharide deacetylase n=1 Tax=Halalkalibacterium halodurans (strain ATCC BAA-125 / DSM 18197 / FERM 7344 / JCM 9153 / C-125) TaxID=272558 RepID=Q9KBK9_HALH5|nr:polysaccharide deacetylase family protein [Halalkalibacterium halodurans]MED3648827.1 polysaccharide deacetylase family protein [Halalkalibacterium halodurans]MED4082679.1 polysaccharide deacetylase family protein [Halalkalibacterium halodurans]MED4085879.1 polysaccharide deacetylase family protein [Halalkalibacterium halodurans]MED4106847.1 polysaccharide deacetylase family protein [Halalkalibacterium halodurans]MED4109757.1 polysaccharide deacetylase family protein [Halalkalibacterium hal
MKTYRKILLAVVCLLLFFLLPVGMAFANDHGVNWFKRGEERQIPDPEGGAEMTQRIPVSNVVLQQRYPDTVVLAGPTTANRIALTFDDGPDPRFTPQVLDVLQEYNVPATFFVMGRRAERFPDLVTRMAAEGHVIGNHSYSHPNFVVEDDVALLEQEVLQTEAIIQNLVGYRPRFFRAPYGFLYNELVEKLAELNNTVVAWSIDTLDWRERPAEEVAFSVISSAQPGSIVLMHDGAEADGDRTQTIEALRQIIPTLQEQGFEFVTVSELIGIPYEK